MRPDIYVLYLLLRLVGLFPLRTVHGGRGRMGRLRPGAAVAQHPRHGGEPGLARPGADRAAASRLLREAMRRRGRSVTEVAAIWGAGADRSLGLVREVVGGELLEAALAVGQGRDRRRAASGLLGAAELLALQQDADGDSLPAAAHRGDRGPAAQGARQAGAGAGAADGAGVRTLFKRLGRGGTSGILPDQRRARAKAGRPFFGWKR